MYGVYGGHRKHPSVDGMIFAQITNDAGAELFPSLSTDGTSVVYAGKSAGNWDIYLHRAGEAEAVNLTKDTDADDTQPAFSPDGRLIAFRSERSGGGIYVMRDDGTNVRRVADGGFNPAWSPDGRQLVYAEESITRPEDRSGRLSHLWTLELATGHRKLLTGCSRAGRRTGSLWRIGRSIWMGIGICGRCGFRADLRFASHGTTFWIGTRCGRRMAGGCTSARIAAAAWGSGGFR
jgi:hypothetical protein